MKRKNVKWISIFMVIAMIIVMTAACGGKEDEKDSDRAEATEETATEEAEPEEESEADDVQAEAPAEELTEEQKAAQAEKEAMIKAAEERGVVFDDNPNVIAPSGVPEDVLQQLYDSIRTSVTDEYLTKYGISPEEFRWTDNMSDWDYLQSLIEQKIKFLKDGMQDEPTPNVEVDAQTAELMNIMYNKIIEWIQANNLDLLQMYSTPWADVIRTNITFR